MRHRRHPINTDSVRRRTTWARFGFNTNLTTGTMWSNFDLLSNYKTDGGTSAGITIARIHMRLVVTTAVAAGDTFSWGILRGQNTDVGTSPAGSPNALADPYEDWMFWEAVTADTNGHYFPGGGNVRTLDLKAQRKIPELMQALICSVGPGTNTALDLKVTTEGSVLVMLP
jgi:hypothetical protein